MKKPSPETVAAFDAALPDDLRSRRGSMFGHACAFVNGNMYYGTFGDSFVLRVGEPRTAALAKGPLRVFAPMPGRLWKEYLQADRGALAAKRLAELAKEALEWSSALPPKGAKKPGKPAAKAKTVAAKPAAEAPPRGAAKASPKAAPKKAAPKAKTAPKRTAPKSK